MFGWDMAECMDRAGCICMVGYLWIAGWVHVEVVEIGWLVYG